jgi:hypothetical protein
MSDLRHCPGCGLDRGGYYSPTPEDWQCDDCHARRVERGRQAVIEYATALNYDDPAEWTDHEQTAVDLVADILHYLESIDSPDPADILPPATRHYEAERLGRFEENR